MIDDTPLIISTVMLGVKHVVNKYGNPEIAPKQMNDELDEVYHTALTAIYEIGLGVIGEDESLKGTDFKGFTLIKWKNEFRASQRKAWAKACGVAE